MGDSAHSTSLPSPRPRFELRTSLSPEQVMHRMRAFLARTEEMRGGALLTRIELSMAGDEQRLWSPQIVVDVERDGDGGSVLHARFGPDPYVWAMYLLAYLALTVLTLIALAFGVSQLILGHRPIGLYAAPGGAVLAALVYGASFVGQGLATEQMYLLRATVEEVARGSRAAGKGEGEGEGEGEGGG